MEGLFQPTHLILVLIIALVVFGPGKLPEIGSALGKGIRDFRQSMRELNEPLPEEQTRPCPTCGRANPTSDRFCGGCGSAMESRAG